MLILVGQVIILQHSIACLVGDLRRIFLLFGVNLSGKCLCILEVISWRTTMPDISSALVAGRDIDTD